MDCESACAAHPHSRVVWLQLCMKRIGNIHCIEPKSCTKAKWQKWQWRNELLGVLYCTFIKSVSKNWKYWNNFKFYLRRKISKVSHISVRKYSRTRILTFYSHVEDTWCNPTYTDVFKSFQHMIKLQKNPVQISYILLFGH